jgi:tRNA A-37 threonylcarbamoyl transferase component Bud32/dienelactone hydrolase
VTPERWSRLRTIFGAALETPEPERPQFLDSACGDDADLRSEVERMLAGAQEVTWQSPAARLPAAAAELTPGDTLTHFRVEARLGAGGMGVVYHAYDSKLHRKVALKVLPPESLADPRHRRRLLSEARAASALNHPNIVTVYEVGSEGGTDFIAMEYIEGQSLTQAIVAQKIPWERILEYAVEIATALAKAHASDIIHRDLKPANIMLTVDGHVKLLDFGLAQRSQVTDPAAATATVTVGGIAGTVGYMSPEQLRGLPVDGRTDLFALGVILYEMVTGARPFQGDSMPSVIDATLHAKPLEIAAGVVPGKLKAIIFKLLEKEPGGRYPSAEALLNDLREFEASQSVAHPVRRLWVAVGVAAIILVLGALWWFGRRWSRERWALGTAAPQAEHLIDQTEYTRAAMLLQEARGILPKNPTLEKLWMLSTGDASFTSEPQGAVVSYRPYNGDPNVWRVLGKTPVEKTRVPRGEYVWRVFLPGFAPVELIGSPALVPPPGFHTGFSPKVKLRPAKEVPAGMVPVSVSEGPAALAYPLGVGHSARLAPFLIDRDEVTNEEYKKFVDAGGYRRPEFWKQRFLKDGRTLSWREALALFRDSTGQPGPATWEVGDYPKGRARHPVGGLSWFEAAAYAEFVGKSLPTAYHWTMASQPGQAPWIVPGGNFMSLSARPVGSAGAYSGFGTNDMAGNVKEWCWNESSEGRRLILGGGFGEPNYMFYLTDARSPWERQANFGFRCASYDSPPGAEIMARIEYKGQDYRKTQPVSDAVYRTYVPMYVYDKSADLNAKVEPLGETEGWTREKVTFDAAYYNERVPAYLFLPKNARPPFQPIIYFPGAFAFLDDKFDLAGLESGRGFLLKSGRAVIAPIYKGLYERRDDIHVGVNPPLVWRDHFVAWAKDLGRTIDYLETRKDIDATKIAYFGDSLGGKMGALLPALEKRLKVVVLSSGGFYTLGTYPPEANPFNFVPRVVQPVLMVNGRYDTSFPYDSCQRPLFEHLGTPAKDKRHVIYETGHNVFTDPDAVRECLTWLDTYLGPVRP